MAYDTARDWDPKFTSKVMVITFLREDYKQLEEMLEIAREKIPTLKCVDDVCGVILAEVCRARRAGETPALPGVKSS